MYVKENPHKRLLYQIQGKGEKMNKSRPGNKKIMRRINHVNFYPVFWDGRINIRAVRLSLSITQRKTCILKVF